VAYRFEHSMQPKVGEHSGWLTPAYYTTSESAWASNPIMS